MGRPQSSSGSQQFYWLWSLRKVQRKNAELYLPITICLGCKHIVLVLSEHIWSTRGTVIEFLSERNSPESRFFFSFLPARPISVMRRQKQRSHAGHQSPPLCEESKEKRRAGPHLSRPVAPFQNATKKLVFGDTTLHNTSVSEVIGG